MIPFRRWLAGFMSKCAYTRTIDKLQYDICSGATTIYYDDLKTLYTIIQNENIDLSKQVIGKDIKFTLLPKNDLDEFGFAFNMKASSDDKTRTSIQILLRSEQRHDKSIFIRRYTDQNGSGYITTYVFDRCISVNNVLGMTKTPATMNDIESLILTIKRYFKYVFDTYELHLRGNKA